MSGSLFEFRRQSGRLHTLGGQTENAAGMCVCVCVCVCVCNNERFKPHVLCKKTHPNNFHTPTGWNGLKDLKGEASWEGVGFSIHPAWLERKVRSEK